MIGVGDRTYDLTTKESSKRDIGLLLEQKKGEKMMAFVRSPSEREKEMLRDSMNAVFVSTLCQFLAVCLVSNLFQVAYSTMIILGGVLIYMTHQVYLRWREARMKDTKGDISVRTFKRNDTTPSDTEKSQLVNGVSDSIGNFVRKDT
tara:strand:+ start:2637 stop:3077 length:441 start_codon:yes stop_codon:yes gene_type:complete